jgi:hypothetical protein
MFAAYFPVTSLGLSLVLGVSVHVIRHRLSKGPSRVGMSLSPENGKRLVSETSSFLVLRILAMDEVQKPRNSEY